MAQDKDQKTLNVPPLRFPGFTDEWKRIKGSDLLDFYSTNSLSWEMLNYEYGDLHNLHYGLIHSGLPTLIDLKRDTLPFVNDTAKPKNYTLCKEGDIAFADASEDTNDVAKAIEFINLEGQQVISGLHTIHGRDNGNKTVVGFKGYAFASSSFHNQIRRIAQGTKIYSISSKSFDEVFISIPNKTEQTKIARLLHLIDERIATQNKIIEDLKKLKSAIIDSHFDGQKVNRRIGDLIHEVSNRNKSNTDLPVLSVSNRQGFIAQSEQFENRVIASDDTSNYKIVIKDDFAYNPARINVRSIARLVNYESGIVSPMYLCFRCSNEILPEYLELFFQSRNFQLEVEKKLEGSVRLCLSMDGMKSIQFSLPPIYEQKALTKRLKAIQSKLSYEETLNLLYQAQRRYLLTNLFI